MRKVLFFLLRLYLLPLNLLSMVLDQWKPEVLNLHLCQFLYSGKKYHEISFFPKTCDTIKVKGSNSDFSEMAIILQGPIMLKDDFTINTIKLYFQYYNNLNIIVSTWKDSDPATVKKIREMGACVILNEYPMVNGVGNLNYQLTTSLAGVKTAKQMGVKYALKTRTDQRYYNPCALVLLKRMYMEGKLIMMGGIYNSFSNKCFQISDFMAFGTLSEMEILYSRPFDVENTKNIKKTRRHQYENITYFEKYIQMVRNSENDIRESVPKEYQNTSLYYANPETLLTYGYFCEKEDINKYDTVQHAYNEFLKKHVMIVDADLLGFYWPKYTYGFHRMNYFDREGKLDMGRWLSIIDSEESDK